MQQSESRPLSLIIAVAEADTLLAEELKKRLQPLSRAGQLAYWFLDQAPPGKERVQVIEEQCRQANLFLMLLSSDFFSSSNCRLITRLARKRESEGRALVLPVRLRAVNLEGTAFHESELLLPDDLLIDQGDEGWAQIIKHIRTLIDSISVVPQSGLLDFHNPYKGLRAFESEDANDFFGRTVLIENLLTELKNILADDRTRLLAVVGPSGVGKSSVVLAGLLPRLKTGDIVGSEHWIVLPYIKMGSNPLEALAVSLASSLPKERSKESIYEDLKAGPEADRTTLHRYLSQIVFKQAQDSRVVLVIDQMEELFQPGVHPDDRYHFLSLLLEAIEVKQGKQDLLLVVITLRDDFLHHIEEFPEFARLVSDHPCTVSQMLMHEIREAIEKPVSNRVQFDKHLVDNILRDLQGQSGPPLPMLQFTLEQLFEAREGRRLTEEAYKQIGGIKGAVERQAEKTYNGLLDEQHREWVQRIFLRLVNPGVSEQETTRKRESKTNLLDMADPDLSKRSIVKKCIDDFVNARLLTASKVEVVAPAPAVVTHISTIEVSHEVVLREWPRLQHWIRDNYTDLCFQRDLANAIVEWERHQKASDWLYRGPELEKLKEWVERNSPMERERIFLQASSQEEKASPLRKIMQLCLAIVLIVASIGGMWWWWATHPPAPDPTRVTNTQDGGLGSLRWCLTTAPANSTITVDPIVRGTIVLNGTLTIGKSLTIKGPGENVLTLKSPGTGIGLNIAPLMTVSISALSFTEGGSAHATVSSETIHIESAGTLHLDHVTVAHNHSVGIENVGTLVLSNAAISDNSSSFATGGVVNDGIVTITNSTITGNSFTGTSGSRAGGVDNYSSGTMTISNSTISHNSSVYGVGGVVNRVGGSMIISNATISNNSSPEIGGVDNAGTMSITSSTISDNSAIAISGVGNAGIMTIANSTLTNNSSSNIAAIDTELGGKTTLLFCTVAENPGKGIALRSAFKGKANTVIMQDTILVATSIVIQDPYSVFQSMGYNLVDTANAQFFQQASDRSVQNPFYLFDGGILLGQNGGITETIKIRSDSQAYNAIPVEGCHIPYIYDKQTNAYTDQRGQTRPGKGKTQCDIGAYEMQQ